MTNAQEVGDWLDETIKHLGPLNGAANLAGVLKLGDRIASTKDEDWDFVMGVNLKGVFNCLRAELQRMDGPASIVNAASTAGLRGFTGGAAYATSKVRSPGPPRRLSESRGSRGMAETSARSARGHRPHALRGPRSRREEHPGQLHRPVSARDLPSPPLFPSRFQSADS